MSYRILALSHFDRDNSVFEDYCSGLRANSSNYYYFDYIELYLNSGKTEFEKTILDLVASNNIEYVFIIIWSGDLTFDLSFLEKLSKVTKIVFNFFDTEHFFDSVEKYYAQVAHLVILANYLPKFRFELFGINTFCTFALYDKTKYILNKNTVKTIDVSFVGNILKSNRSNYIDFLVNNNINVEIYGKGSQTGFVDFDKMIQIFNSSKINLNFSESIENSKLILGENINNHIMQIKGRINEITLSGGFVLSEYVPGIEHMYNIGQEIDVFKSKQEMLDKIRYYLIHDETRGRIAKNGHSRAIGNYDSNLGLAKAICHLNSLNHMPKKIYLDRHFITNYSTYRFLWILRFLKHYRFRYIVDEIKVIIKYREFSINQAINYFVKLAYSSLHSYKFPNYIMVKLLKLNIKY